MALWWGGERLTEAGRQELVQEPQQEELDGRWGRQDVVQSRRHRRQEHRGWKWQVTSGMGA